MQAVHAPPSRPRLATLFFLHGMAMAMWFVPLTVVLEAHGYAALRPPAFAASALAAFISPLIFGAMADRHASPVRVLRALGMATALAMALAATAIHRRWPGGVVLALIQLHAICSAPTFSISSTIVLAGIGNPRKEFGPLRAMATLGWMAGCCVVSVAHADTSALAGYAGALTWLGVAAFTTTLPEVPPPPAGGRLTVRERLGLDALTLLKHPDTRVVFLTVALFAIPIAAFYPYTPPNLRELGFTRTSAWMSIGQVSEILAMLAVGGLLANWRLKWIIASGLTLGVLRYALCALDGPGWLLAGIALHGGSFTLVFITAQVYLDERVDRAWRTRAQALLSFLISGFGYLVGYLGSGWWFQVCTRDAGVRWAVFWGGLAVVVAGVLTYFLLAYRGRGPRTAPLTRVAPET